MICLSAVLIITLQLQSMALVKEGNAENAGEWAGKAERQWKEPTTDNRKAKDEMDIKEAGSVQLLGL